MPSINSTETEEIMSRKKELILTTYELLKTTNPENIKIRTIASESHCTTPVIYKHFENLDELIQFAGVRYLENYIIDFLDVLQNTEDPLEMLVSSWKIFAHYAFQAVDIFEMMFWGKYKEGLGNCLYEYYQLFPEKLQGMDGLFTSVFFNNDIKERNYFVVRRASSAGYFSTRTDRMFSDMQVYFFHGLLLDYRDTYRQKGVSEQAEKCFDEMFSSLIDKYRR